MTETCRIFQLNKFDIYLSFWVIRPQPDPYRSSAPELRWGLPSVRSPDSWLPNTKIPSTAYANTPD